MCEDCSRDLNRFDPACLTCGQRYIRDIQARQIGADTKRAWLRSVLKTWMDFGHAEAQIRARYEPPKGKRK